MLLPSWSHYVHMFLCPTPIPSLTHIKAVRQVQKMPLKLWSLCGETLYVFALCKNKKNHNTICQSVSVQCLRIYSNITLCFVLSLKSVLWMKQAKITYPCITKYIYSSEKLCFLKLVHSQKYSFCWCCWQAVHLC